MVFYIAHKVFHFSNEVEIDRAISSSLNRFHRNYDGETPCDANEISNLIETLGLSLFSHTQKIRQVFFHVPGKQTCNLHICSHLGGNNVTIHIVEYIKISREMRVTDYLVWSFFILFLFLLVSASSIMVYFHQ